MRVARPEEKEVVVAVPESRLEELRAARQVLITLWAEPDAKFKGRIREISPSADPVTRTYTVKVTILEPSPKVQLGMTANVLLGSGESEPVIRLPLTALFQQGDKAAVWIVDPKTGLATLTPVELARYTQDAVEIASGLKPGDLVVRAGVHKLHAGTEGSGAGGGRRMKGPNLSEWALEHQSFILFLIIALALAGAYSYLRLGQAEDPDFTFKVMVRAHAVARRYRARGRAAGDRAAREEAAGDALVRLTRAATPSRGSR